MYVPDVSGGAPPRWSHRNTWPESRNDRVVLCNGKGVGRTYRLDHGPQRGRWAWFGWWAGLLGNIGTEATLTGALEALRAGFQEARSGASRDRDGKPRGEEARQRRPGREG